ncbi:hypothetical protein CXB51_004021 [Gossypium anomalum]|uniref:Uncharacterized protein n=1 Tax=Gossypium anomalum TaxID=47600 RepID=A0A8J6D7P4_9ROSI|nr:hypothetical protein CXB51_004021 [Gossypium anomalum]
MASVECSDVVLSILFKAASLKGMSYFVYIAYCYVLATLVFVPLTFLSNRKKLLLQSEFPLISRIFLLGLLGYPSAILHQLLLSYLLSFLVIPSSTSSSASLQWPLESTQSNWVIGWSPEALAYLFFFILVYCSVQSNEDIPEEITGNVYYNMSVGLIALAACLIKEQNLSYGHYILAYQLFQSYILGTFRVPIQLQCSYIGRTREGACFRCNFRPTSIVIAVSYYECHFLGKAVDLERGDLNYWSLFLYYGEKQKKKK